MSSSSILNHKDSLISTSTNNDSISNLSTSTLNETQSKSNVMENYLILDRLNQKQQRKQQIKQKQQQQLDELRQKQHDLESKVQEKQMQQQQQAADDQNNFINSKLTSHYNETNSVNTPILDQTKFKLKVHHQSQLQQFQLNQKLNSQNKFIQNAHDLNSKSLETTKNSAIILDSNDKNLNINLKKLSTNKKSKTVSSCFFINAKTVAISFYS